MRVALAIAAGLVATLIYAGQFVASRWSIQRSLSVWDLAALRFGVAGLLLLPVLVRHGLSTAAGIGWGRGVVLCVTAGAPYTLILYTGLAMAPAGHGAAFVCGVTPVVSALLVWFWAGDRPHVATVAGLALIVAGLALLAAPTLRGGGELVWLGDLVFVLDGVLWALFTVLARRWQVDPLRGTAVVWVLSLTYLPIYAALAGPRLLAAPRGEVLFQGFYQGVGVAIAALGLFSWAIRVLGPSSASLFMPLVPVFGVLLAALLLGEIPIAVQVVGMIGVSVGMALAALGHRTLRAGALIARRAAAKRPIPPVR
jgi:drug/metabolite transporter (DMT)-like permease